MIFKWLPSENTSSKETVKKAHKIRNYLGMTTKQYRKMLSYGREKENVLERLMSANEWDKIEFDKIPSRAGFLYKQAFMRHDVERKQAGAKSYADFAKDENTTVNARVLYPYECVAEARKISGSSWYGCRKPDETERQMINKYWANLHNYFEEAVFNGIVMVDVSGSMYGCEASAPINVAISLGLYCADKAKGPYANHFLTFSAKPQMVRAEGIDFYDKVQRMANSEWGMNTNVEAAFDLLLDTAINNHCSQEEIPEHLLIASDMEFDSCCTSGRYGASTATLMERIEAKWNAHGYKMPKLVFWNCQARQDNIPMKDKDGITFVSGFSPNLFEQIMKGKTGKDLMYDKLNSARYKDIR